ncbi:MAG: hypothetical protein WBY88_05285 [Desulfosarcina sp.]
MKRLPKFVVYKKTGAMQFSLTPADHSENDEFAYTKGFVMLEMAGANGQRSKNELAVYDWKNKVTMKLNEVDIQQILTGFQVGKMSIVHDPTKANNKSAPKKFLTIEKATQSGFFVSMNFGDRNTKSSLSDEEARNLRLLLSKAITRIFGW